MPKTLRRRFDMYRARPKAEPVYSVWNQAKRAWATEASFTTYAEAQTLALKISGGKDNANYTVLVRRQDNKPRS